MLIQTARLNDVDPQAWLANVLAASTITISRSSISLKLEDDFHQARRLKS